MQFVFLFGLALTLALQAQHAGAEPEQSGSSRITLTATKPNEAKLTLEGPSDVPHFLEISHDLKNWFPQDPLKRAPIYPHLGRAVIFDGRLFTGSAVYLRTRAEPITNHPPAGLAPASLENISFLVTGRFLGILDFGKTSYTFENYSVAAGQYAYAIPPEYPRVGNVQLHGFAGEEGTLFSVDFSKAGQAWYSGGEFRFLDPDREPFRIAGRSFSLFAFGGIQHWELTGDSPTEGTFKADLDGYPSSGNYKVTRSSRDAQKLLLTWDIPEEFAGDVFHLTFIRVSDIDGYFSGEFIPVVWNPEKIGGTWKLTE